MNTTNKKKSLDDELFLKNFPRNNPFPVLCYDLSGKLIFCNKPGKIIHQSLRTRIKPDSKIFSRFIRSITKNRKVSINPLRVNNLSFHIECRLNDTNDSFNLYGRDITEELIIKNRLITEKDEAVRFTRQKSKFIASVSHEIRTPMHGMLGVIKLLKETELNSEQSDLLSILSECGSGLVNLINDVMDISKIEHDKEIILRPSNFNLLKICENAINLFKPICTEKKLNLVLNYQSKAENYIGDSSRVNQILNNLLGNATKFTESGTITLSVYNEQEIDSQQVYFKISDTGIGMDKDFLKQIFTPYSQADDSTSRVHQGTGLGLTITKAILDQMNGEIKVTSELGVGTSFDFNIPLKKSEEIIENVEKINDQFNFLFAKKYPHRVLLVEDNKINQLVLKKWMSKLGYKITIKNSGTETLEMNDITDYSLILMDVHMPEIDGIDTAREIHSRHGSQTPCIIFITADVLDKSVASAIQQELGASILSKPLAIHTLKYLLMNTYYSK